MMVTVLCTSILKIGTMKFTILIADTSCNDIIDCINFPHFLILTVTFMFKQVKMCHLPTLPRYKELVSKLSPIHDRLSRESSIAMRHPVYRCNEMQVFTVVLECLMILLFSS